MSNINAVPDQMDVVAVRNFIRANWQSTIRSTEAGAPEDRRLPAAFVVPTAGPHFRLLFYWDTYFTSLGLAVDDRLDAAKGSADCFIHLLETRGYVPNFSPVPCNRSQPPVASMLFRLVYDRMKDREWLARAVKALELEYAFWMNLRIGPDGLNCAGHHEGPAAILHFVHTVKDRLHPIPEAPLERMTFLAHAMAECEIWDFTPRFEKRCQDFYPICQNSLLYALETNMAYFSRELGLGGESLWEERASRRRELINRFCWSDEAGAYLDYDWRNRRQGRVLSAAAFYPLWCGLASPAQAARMRDQLAVLEYPSGLTTCVPGTRDQVYQWDHPNAWPPLQLIAVEGLRRYGFDDDACRLARKYVDIVVRNYKASGTLWEKYNCEDGSIRVKDEYDMPPMLGWTAGVFVHFCEIFNIR